ncbi:hypothetical protein BBA71_07325 [Acetobacter pasteurianus]|nr:hypothetical protein BBA71_07325 [Acetobacter pasteurianus]
MQTISEQRTILTYSDEDLERISWVVFSMNFTIEPEEPPNWGHFPTLRAFWSAILHVFENDSEVRAGESFFRTNSGRHLSVEQGMTSCLFLM